MGTHWKACAAVGLIDTIQGARLAMADIKETTVIAADTVIKGEMTFEHTARIQGRFEGKIAAKGELQVAESAVCAAEVAAGNIIVDGSVDGNVQAQQKIQLNAKAKLKGDIVAERLITAEGASIYGHVAVGPEAAKGRAAGGGGGAPAGGGGSRPGTPQQPKR